MISYMAIPGGSQFLLRKRDIPTDKIIEVVFDSYSIPKQFAYKSNKHGRSKGTEPRQVCCYIMITICKKKHKEVANIFGIDRASIYNSCKIIEGFIDVDEAFIRKFNGIMSRL